MTSQPRDPDLRGLFQKLLEEDRRGAPSFQEVMAGARKGAHTEGSWAPGREKSWSPITRRLTWGGSLLAAAAAAALLLLPGPGTSEAEFELAVRSFSTHPAGGAWRSPTDLLLDLPGSKVLSTLPSIGSRHWPAGTGRIPRLNQL